MLITERDIEIMKFINEFGYCEMPQIEKRFNLKRPRSYKVIKRLIERNLVKHEFVLRNKHGVYRLTKQGAAFTDLPPLKYVSLGRYLHQLAVVNVHLDLIAQNPNAKWITERRLRRNKFLEKGYRRNGHTADGILILPDNKKIAVEVELTMKDKERLKKILRGYYANFEIAEVWYFCAPEIITRIKNISGPDSIFNFYNLK